MWREFLNAQTVCKEAPNNAFKISLRERNRSPLKCKQEFATNVPASRAIYQSGPSTGLFRDIPEDDQAIVKKY